MTTSESLTHPFQCVLCDNLLNEGSSGDLSCGTCGASYPQVGGIRVLHLNPDELLRSYASEISVEAKERYRHEKLLDSLKERSVSPESLSRLEKSFKVTLANRALLKELFAPVAAYLAKRPPSESMLGPLTVPTARWPFPLLLPYFYRDWSGSKEAEAIAQLFAGAIEDHCDGPRGGLAVLGCGACGLLYRLAGSFPASYGVDISMPALLMARRLLEGGELILHFNLPSDRFPRSQRRVTLRAPAAANDFQLIAANVTSLPFAASSLSCVTTQYVLDLVTQQRRLISEIHRVLAPGGVWINFGLPGGSNAYDTPAHLDLPSYLLQGGFETLEWSVHRSRHLDLSDLSAWRSTITYGNMFFVAKKSALDTFARAGGFAEYFAGTSGSLSRMSLKLAEGVQLAVGHKKRFSQDGMKEGSVIELQIAGEEPFAIDMAAEEAEFFQRFLLILQESSSASALVNAVSAALGPIVAEKEVVLLLKSLYELGVLACNETPSSCGM